MAPSVLGKRQLTVESTDSTSLRPSSKRLTQENAIHDDNEEDPFVSPPRRRSSRKRSSPSDDANTPSHNLRAKRICRDNKISSPCKTKTHTTVTAEQVNDENVEPSPEFTTPRTQRYKNALPQSLPVTPRHRVQLIGKPLTPRTPRTPSTPKNTRTVYTTARQLFARSADPGPLVGRDNEREEIDQFIRTSINARKGGCMYVSGPPGTGKSALIDEVCRDVKEFQQDSTQVANVNCASMTSAKDIYGKLIEDLCDDSLIFKKSQSERLREMFLPKKSSKGLYVVVLDEIDHLLTADTEILYTLFEWSLQKSSRLALIGIANALDLTDRFLPRLKANNLKPHLLPFLPYTATQITNVVTARLRSLLPNESGVQEGYVPFLHPAAIQLCSRKVASQSGDLRKAFDIVCRTIDLLERETLKKLNDTLKSPSKAPLLENKNLASPNPQTISSPEHYTVANAPRATVAHIARVTSSTFGHGTVERLQGLNLQQKAALCALIAFGRKQRTNNVYKTPTKSPRSAAPTTKELFDTYSVLCRRDNNILHPLTSSEFKDVVGSLETMGLIGEINTRGRGTTSPTGSSGVFSTPTKSGRGRTSALGATAGADNRGLVCYVGEKEVEKQVSGPGEGILKALLSSEDL